MVSTLPYTDVETQPWFQQPSAPYIPTYAPDVEKWRPLVAKYFKPEDVEKALYVINGESGGNPTIKNSTGSGATGLFQIMPFHGVDAANPETAVQWAASQVANHGWSDWGEGVTYQGQPFGVLGLTPYGGQPVATASASAPDAATLGALNNAGYSSTDTGSTLGSAVGKLAEQAPALTSNLKSLPSWAQDAVNGTSKGLLSTVMDAPSDIYNAGVSASHAISPAAVLGLPQREVIDPLESVLGLQKKAADVTRNPVESYLHKQAVNLGGGQIDERTGQIVPGGVGSAIAGAVVPDNAFDQVAVLQGLKDAPAVVGALAHGAGAVATEGAARLASSETANRLLPDVVLPEQRVGAQLARHAGVDPLEGARARVGLAGAADDASNAPLPGQPDLFGGRVPSVEHDPQIANKFLTAAEAEAKLRTSGVVESEIRAGRAQQAHGIMGSMESGQSLDEAGKASSQGAYQGGTLRKTFIPKVELNPEEGQKLVASLHDQMIAGEVSPFEYKQLVTPENGIIARLQSDTAHLQPAEIRLIHRVFGGEANATLEDIAGELQQVRGLGAPKNEFGAQVWPPTEPGAFETKASFGEAVPTGGPIPSKPMTPDEVIAAQKALGMRDNAHALADSTFGFAKQLAAELQGGFGASMTLKSSLSPPVLRQGLVRLFTNPFAAFREFGASLQAARSPEAFDAVNNLLKENPWTSIKIKNAQFSPYRGYTIEDLAGAEDASRTAKNFKLREVGPQAESSARAPEFQGLQRESYISKAIENGPIGKLVGPSERQAASSFNANIVGRYSEVAQKRWNMEEALKLPHDKRDYGAILDTVLHQQQYGSISQSGLPAFFSTRALSGRVQALADVFVQPGSIFQPSARQEAVKGLMAVAGFNMAILGLVSQAPGFSINWNNGLPTLRGPGGLHIDPWAGFNPIVKLPMKIARDLDKELGNGGWEQNKNWDKVFSDVEGRAIDFARNQLGPITGKLADIGTQKDFLGRPYSLTKDIESGRFFRDLMAPFVIDDMIQSLAEDGLRGLGLTTPLSALSTGVGNYTTTGEAKDAAAQKVAPDADGHYPTLTGEKPKGYGDLTPAGRSEVDNSASVTKARGGPTPYKAASDAARADTVAEVQRQEALHEQGQNLKKLSDVYHDQGVANRATAKALEGPFAEQFANFDKTKYDKAVEGYYGQEKKIPDGLPGAGDPDFDATAAAQQDYLEKLPPDVKEWVTQSLAVTEDKKTSLQKQYDAYIGFKKQAGYFDIQPDDPAAAKKREALDKQFPELDYGSWRFNSTADKGGGSLNSLQAVERALADPLADHIPVKYANIERPINQSQGTKDLWAKSGQRIANFFDDAKVAKAYGDDEASQLFAKTNDPKWDKPFAKLAPKDQQTVLSNIRSDIRKDTPEIAGLLAYMGYGVSGNEVVIPSYAAGDEFLKLKKLYGSDPPKKGVTYRYAVNAQ